MKKFNVTYATGEELLSVKANAVTPGSFQPNFIKGFDTCKIVIKAVVDTTSITFGFIVDGQELTKQETISDLESYKIFDISGVEDINIIASDDCDIEVTFLKSNR